MFPVVLEMKLGSPWDKSAAWARTLDDGRVEFELYDFSPEAQEHMGGDVAWLWRVAAGDKQRLLMLLGAHGDKALLKTLARRFPHVHAVRDWLREQGIPLEEQFDSQA